jgi:hypothetical protein
MRVKAPVLSVEYDRFADESTSMLFRFARTPTWALVNLSALLLISLMRNPAFPFSSFWRLLPPVGVWARRPSAPAQFELAERMAEASIAGAGRPAKPFIAKEPNGVGGRDARKCLKH